MNLTIVYNDYSQNGGTVHMAILMATEWIRCGYNVTLYDFHPDKPLFYPLPGGVTRNGSVNSSILYGIKQLRKFIFRNSVDVVIAVDIGILLYAIPATLGHQCKLIAWEHSNYNNNWGSKIIPILRQLARKFCHAIVVLTNSDREAYLGGTTGKAKLVNIPNPIAKQSLLQYNCDSKVILSIGNLIPIKRFDLLLQTAALIHTKHNDWCFEVWGIGFLQETLIQKCKQMRLENVVFFKGLTDCINDEYRKAAMYVMTSEMEGLPMVLLEAKSHGLPIVSFDIMTGPSEIIRDGVNGYLVESGNVEAMAERIIELIKDGELRQRFSDASQLDMDKFDREKVVGQWQVLLEKLMK